MDENMKKKGCKATSQWMEAGNYLFIKLSKFSNLKTEQVCKALKKPFQKHLSDKQTRKKT